MTDATEAARREMIETGQPEADAVEAIMKREQTWTTEQLTADFEVIGFAAPFVVVKRRSDGKKCSLEFARGGDGERYYFGWEEA